MITEALGYLNENVKHLKNGKQSKIRLVISTKATQMNKYHSMNQNLKNTTYTITR